MFDPIQYMIAQEGIFDFFKKKKILPLSSQKSEDTSSSISNILDTIKSQYPNAISEELKSVRRSIENYCKISKSVILRAKVPGIVYNFDDFILDDLDEFMILPNSYREKMDSFAKSYKFLCDYDNYEIHKNFLSFYVASTDIFEYGKEVYGPEKSVRDPDIGIEFEKKFDKVAEDIYNKLKSYDNFWGVSWDGDWDTGFINIYMKPSDKFLKIARDCGYKF